MECVERGDPGSGLRADGGGGRQKGKGRVR